MVKTQTPAGDSTAAQSEPGVAAVNRALSLLAAFSKEHSSLTLAQRAERTALYKSTILRLAESLDKGAGGRVLLAFGGTVGVLCDEVRRTLFALTLGERDRDTAAVACPVFGPADALEGALSVSGPIQRFTPAAVGRMRASLFAAARTLTIGLGGDPDIYLQAQPSKGSRR